MSDPRDRHPSDDERPSEPHEEAEAEALAVALERGHREDELPEDALEAAALIRYSLDHGELPADREDAILAEVIGASEKVRARQPAPPPRRFGWLFGIFATSVAAILVLVLILRQTWFAPERPSALPRPSPELVRASLSRVEGEAADPSFEGAMQPYRSEVYSALRERYGP
ncbi:MAG: hypothetical protein AB7S26_13975 [Sandaracinaceae bacterium]